MNILIIDDDVKYVSYLVKDLESTFNHAVTWLKAPDNAIPMINEIQFDAIILDIMMPVPKSWDSFDSQSTENGMSTGFVLLNKIRNYNPNLPVLIYSAKEVDIEINAFTKYIRKPALNSNINDLIYSMHKLNDHE